jgi:hypothetical protein
MEYSNFWTLDLRDDDAWDVSQFSDGELTDFEDVMTESSD